MIYNYEYDSTGTLSVAITQYVCPVCGRDHQRYDVRRRWLQACDRSVKLAKGDTELASRWFKLELERSLEPPYVPGLYLRQYALRTVWVRPTVPAHRRSRISLRPVYRKRKREARPGWRRVAA